MIPDVHRYVFFHPAKVYYVQMSHSVQGLSKSCCKDLCGHSDCFVTLITPK